MKMSRLNAFILEVVRTHQVFYAHCEPLSVVAALFFSFPGCRIELAWGTGKEPGLVGLTAVNSHNKGAAM